MTDKEHPDEKHIPETDPDPGREQAGPDTGRESLPEASFSILVSSLASQAMISLGALKNPVTGKTEKNIQQARLTIDLLDLLQEKTRGNLDKQEEQLLNSVLYQLHLQYTEGVKQGGSE